MAGWLQNALDDVGGFIEQQYSPEELKKNLSAQENPGLRQGYYLNKAKKDAGEVGKAAKAVAKGTWTGGGKDDSTLDPSGDKGDVGGKDYKFTEVSGNPEGEIKDYAAGEPNEIMGPVAGGEPMTKQLEKVLGGVQNPEDISPNEYAKLTEAAHKGNKLAQTILVKGKFKAQDYPSLSQDLNKLEDPFVKALSGLPALAENEAVAAQKVTQPYDFTNAEAQVNNLLGQMGSSQQMTTSPETNSYLSGLQNTVNEGKGNLMTSPFPGAVPSVMQALEGLGPAAKESEKATPYEGILASMLSRLNYQIETGTSAPSSSTDPAWLQNLIASVSGTTAGGSLVSPTIAAGGVGATPSTGATTVPNT